MPLTPSPESATPARGTLDALATAPRHASTSGGSYTTSLLTDHYELTMLQAALQSGAAHRRSVFELFTRRLPAGRRYGVVAGTGRLLDALERFRFDDADLGWLSDAGVVDDATLRWLADYRFTGTVTGYPEGEVYFPGAPLVVVESSFAEGVVIETLALSIYNHDSAIAAAASRMINAAGGRPCIEMGSRRTHERAAVSAARAAYVCGFAATSNLEAGRRYGVPTTGTAAHAFTLLHDSEAEAFAAQVQSLGGATTLLVDTYDVETAVGIAVDTAGPGLGAVRLDSGDLGDQARSVRRHLDRLGATGTRIIVTSDLDEYAIAALAAAPVDGYGVGTSLVTGSGAPTCSMVYKLVARESVPGGPLIPVGKRSLNKPSTGGRKSAYRRLADGHAVAEVVVTGHREHARASDRPLHVPLVVGGEVVGREPLSESRARHQRVLAELPRDAFHLTRGEPALDTISESA